jgi:uncharacterized protein (TIGR02001 family)
MKKNRRIWACIAAATVIFASQAVVMAEEEVKPAAAEASKPTAAVDMGVFSQYIWRGLELSYNSVVIQPSVTLGYEGFSLNVWGNMDTDQHIRGSEDSTSKYTETDFTLSYAKTLGPVKLTGGYIYYALAGTPQTGSQDTQELYVSATLDTILSPTLSIYRDIANTPAWYINLGISHSQPIYEKITLDLAASAGYYYSDDNDFSEINDPGSRYREFHNGLVTAGLTIPFGEYFSVKPLIGYSFPLSGKSEDFIKATSISDNSSFFYGGVTLSMAF